MKIKRTLLVAALGGAVAHGVSAQDWGGFYAGLSTTSSSMDMNIVGAPAAYSADDGAALGIFAGYNYVLSNNMVVGGELSYADVSASDYPANPYTVDSLAQLRGRLGYANGNVMPYLAIGYASTDFQVPGGPSTNEEGWSFGIGAEMMVGTNMSLRAEYSRATFDSVGENVYFAPDQVDIDLDTLSIGLAMHF